MSITNEITRLQTAKADIKSAIEGKGVTVPSVATLDDYADYVDSIQTASPVTVTDTTDTAGGIIRTITAQGAVIPSASGAFSKIILNGITQIDLTQDTVAAANLLTGETAHGADGQPVVGAASGGGVSFEDSLTNNITSYTNETITSIREYAFQGLTHLTKVWLPALTTLTGFQPFDSTGIDALVLPNLSVVASSPTYYLRFKGTKMDLSKLATFGANLFNNSNNMNVLVVRNSIRVTLGNINAFQNTPFASGKAGGTLYVPSALISEYQTATNWSTILGYTNNNIVAIEGSQYENYYADGTPIPTT